MDEPRSASKNETIRPVVVDDRGRGAGHGTTLLAWLALVVAVAALVLAWAAFNRTGEDLERRIQQEIGEVVSVSGEKPSGELGMADTSVLRALEVVQSQ